jgi:hypothetical protein
MPSDASRNWKTPPISLATYVLIISGIRDATLDRFSPPGEGICPDGLPLSQVLQVRASRNGERPMVRYCHPSDRLRFVRSVVAFNFRQTLHPARGKDLMSFFPPTKTLFVELVRRSRHH